MTGCQDVPQISASTMACCLLGEWMPTPTELMEVFLSFLTVKAAESDIELANLCQAQMFPSIPYPPAKMISRVSFFKDMISFSPV